MGATKYTDEHKVYAETLLKEGKTMREIAEIMSTKYFTMTKNAVIGLLSRHKPYSIEEENLVRELYESGQSFANIADKIGRTQGSVSAKINHLGLNKYVAKQDRENHNGVSMASTGKGTVDKDDFIGLRVNQCRFIMGNMRICQHDIVRGSYCQEHYNLCHVKSKDINEFMIDES